MMTSALSFIEAGLSAIEHSLEANEGELRNVQLATLSPAGTPGLRTLVLRGFERFPAYAELHSDARAGKVRDIAHVSQVALLAWSSADRLQIRFEGNAQLHHDDEIAHGRWDALSPRARASYGLRATPGLPTDDPAEQTHLPPEQQFQQFIVIRVALTRVDILRLDPEGGQTRACGWFTSNGIEANWIGPLTKT